MHLDNIDVSQVMNDFQNASDEMQERVSSGIIAEQEYKAQLENCVLETRDILHQMQEGSKAESAINQKRFIVQTVLSLASLIAAVVAAVAAIISLL